MKTEYVTGSKFIELMDRVLTENITSVLNDVESGYELTIAYTDHTRYIITRNEVLNMTNEQMTEFWKHPMITGVIPNPVEQLHKRLQFNLFTFEDYRDAPNGTIVAQDGERPLHTNMWTWNSFDGLPVDVKDLAGTPRRILRWGMGLKD